MDKLLYNFFTVPSFRNDTLPCLVEIASLKIDESDPKCSEYTEKQYYLFVNFVEKTVEVTKEKDLSEEHQRVNETQKPHFEIFCLQLGLLLSEFLKNQIERIETLVTTNPNQFTVNLQIATAKSLDYLIQLSNIPNDELFRVMMEFWHDFSYYIMVTTKGKDLFAKTGDQNLMNLQNETLDLKSRLRTETFPTYCDRL